MSKHIFCLLAFFCYSTTFSQNTSTSPYSSYGIGELGVLDHSVFSGIGNNTISFFDSTFINFNNPSSYSTLAKGMTLFSIGVSSRFSSFSSDDSDATSRVIAMDHVAMGIPFANRFGMSFGLKPFSKRGYDIQGAQAIDSDTINYYYKGFGTTSEVYYGLSGYVIKQARHKLSLGMNVGYIFGTVVNERASALANSFSGGVEREAIRIRSIHYNFGMHYQLNLDTMQRNILTLSATYDPSQSLKSYYSNYLYFSSDISDENSFLVLSSQDEKGRTQLGSVTTFGLRYSLISGARFNQSKKHESQLDVMASYNINNYSEFRGSYETFDIAYDYKNTNSLNIGLQFTPETRIFNKSVNGNILTLIKYRAGVYKSSIPLTLTGETITDFGTTFGFGIPILTQNTISNFNIGVVYGRRGRDVSGIVKENYLGINVGITISPSLNDRWFVKRKLD